VLLSFAVGDWRAGMQRLCDRNTAPIAVERLCAEITKALPSDGIVVADTGYSGIWTGTMIDFNGAGQGYQRAAGSLGWAFPASLGAQCAAGPRKVVCFTGDGGFYYNVGALEPAALVVLNLVVVVSNDGALNQEIPRGVKVYPEGEAGNARTEDL